jgi:hypothetical protein
MKNVHLLPTPQPSRLHVWTDENGSRLALCELEYSHTRNTQNIYITSDEEIKAGDWYYYFGHIIKYEKDEHTLTPNCKKIILTTDQDLIKDGVQAIGDGFLEWFVKNPSCEWVEVIYEPKNSNKLYEIIIPKEEPKQKRMFSEEEVLNFTQTILMQYKFGNKNIEQMDLLKETLEKFKNK